MSIKFLIFSIIFICPFTMLAESHMIADPMRKMNEKTTEFNIFFHKKISNPVATSYLKVVPEPIHRSIRNVSDNLREPYTMANALLQLNFEQTVISFGRFSTNTVFGLLGIIDIFELRTGIDHTKLTLNETTAKWGIPSGQYIVVPFLYGMSLRSILAFSGDILLGPVFITLRSMDVSSKIILAVLTVDFFTWYVDHIYTIDFIINSSIDPYESLKRFTSIFESSRDSGRTFQEVYDELYPSNFDMEIEIDTDEYSSDYFDD
ncbi:MAG: VacJ family lipoprotein [Alphaproteobacteria bacterium]|nr:VacJ family lipoprotein [Alphaproteobacteria bacterium]